MSAATTATEPAQRQNETAARIFHAYSCHDRKIAVCGYVFKLDGAFNAPKSARRTVCLDVGGERYCGAGECNCACCVRVAKDGAP